MKIVSDQQIVDLTITPRECVEWIRESFCMKYESQLPTKISLHPQGSDFINTMPCLLPEKYGRFGVKVVSRIAGHKPSLHSDLLLYDSKNGELLSLMKADWITQMRTGAVAALAIETLQKEDAQVYSFVGLGSTAQATMMCLQAILPTDKQCKVKLLRYKNQAEQFAEKFAHPQMQFEIVDTHEELLKGADVLVSAVTEMPELFCVEDAQYPKGILLVPIHTRGFQNCDLFFDHVFADDKGHVENFKYFHQFKAFNELSEVLLGKVAGRKSDNERILAYNIGLGLHDVWFANKIYERLGC